MNERRRAEQIDRNRNRAVQARKRLSEAVALLGDIYRELGGSTDEPGRTMAGIEPSLQARLALLQDDVRRDEQRARFIESTFDAAARMP